MTEKKSSYEQRGCLFKLFSNFSGKYLNCLRFRAKRNQNGARFCRRCKCHVENVEPCKQKRSFTNLMETSVNVWAEYAKVVGTSASIWTIIQMLAPVPICYQIIRKKSVGDMTVTPYTSAITASFLWLVYGLIVDDQAVIKVNIIAVILQILYILCYFMFTSKKSHVQKQLVGVISFLSLMLSYVYVESNHEREVSFLGFIASIVTVFFFASPLMSVGYVIRIWNSESLPRPLIIATFIVSVQWTLYGYLIDDNFIIITNLLGTILSFIQLGVMLVIPRDGKIVPLINSKEKESKAYAI